MSSWHAISTWCVKKKYEKLLLHIQCLVIYLYEMVIKNICLSKKTIETSYNFEKENIYNHYYEELMYKIYLGIPGLLDYHGEILRSYIISQFFNIKKKRGWGN